MDHQGTAPSATQEIELSTLAKTYIAADPWIRLTTPIKEAPPAKWVELIKRIDDEVTGLLRNRETWKTFREVANRSEVTRAQPYFPLWVGELHGPTQALGIRKMADRDKKTGSFTQLLTRLAEQPNLLTREWFIGDVNTGIALRMDQSFTELADPKYNGYLDPSVPQGDLQALNLVSAKLKHYVDQHVAHAQLRATAKIPTYGDLDAALDLLEELLRKYILLLTRGDRIQGPPVFQMPWDRVFHEAWIQSEP